MKNQNNIVCRKKFPEDKEGYLFLQTKGRGSRAKKSLGFSVDLKQFKQYFDKKDMRFKSGMRNYKSYNEQIEEALKELEKTNGIIIPNSKDKNSFLKFWELKLNEIENHNTRIKKTGIKAKFEKYLSSIGKTDIYFNQLDPALFKGLQTYLKTAKDPKRLTPNVVTHYLKVIKGVVMQKVEEEPSLYIINPFTGIRYDKKEVLDRPVLQDSEIDKLLNTEIEDEKIDLNRDKFLFQVFADGMRVSDLLLLRWNNVLTGLPLKAGTKIPIIPTGIDLKPQLKYRMWKTDAQVETPITYNICIILLKLIGEEYRAHEIMNDGMYPVGDSRHPMVKTGEVKYFEIFKDTPRLTLSQIEEKIDSLCSKAAKKGDRIDYKGYSFTKDLEELKEVIDWLEEKKVSVVERLIEETMYRLTTYIYNNQCQNDFVFPHIKNDFFRNVKTSPESGFKKKLSKEQNQKVLNGETLYNRQLKKVGETTGVITNLISHAGRHSFVQMLINEGAPLQVIMDKLRHTNINTTDKYLRNKSFRNIGVDYTSKIGNKQKHRKQ